MLTPDSYLKSDRTRVRGFADVSVGTLTFVSPLQHLQASDLPNVLTGLANWLSILEIAE